jgi:hypothetical protein
LTTYWDTSAAINAVVSGKVAARLDKGDHFARLHLFSEFFATMTGRGLLFTDKAGTPTRVLFTPDDAAEWLREFAARVTLIELEEKEMLQALKEANAKSIRGGRVHDYVHALAADKARSDVLITRNTGDFTGLLKARVEWP